MYEIWPMRVDARVRSEPIPESLVDLVQRWKRGKRPCQEMNLTNCGQHASFSHRHEYIYERRLLRIRIERPEVWKVEQGARVARAFDRLLRQRPEPIENG
jgi:hypothetical protein